MQTAPHHSPSVDVQVTPDQSIALVEYIAHLSVEDWDMIPYDLAQLGFLPPGTSFMLLLLDKTMQSS